MLFVVFFFKQKTAYEMRISDWSSDVCSSDLPNVPTVQESGYPGFEAYSWIGIFAPAQTPDDVANRLTDAFQKALGDETIKAKLPAWGLEVMGTDGPTVDRYAVDHSQRWNKFVQERWEERRGGQGCDRTG